MAGPRAVFTAEQDAQIVALYSQGYSSRSIVERLQLQCGHRAVIQLLRDFGIEIRTFSEFSPFDCKCFACLEPFVRECRSQKFCKTCIPTTTWRNKFAKYGITKPKFDQMLLEQDGLCAMCFCEITEDTACIDHCHKQGHVRELLCVKCNNGLGYVEDDKFLAAAIRYTEKHRR